MGAWISLLGLMQVHRDVLDDLMLPAALDRETLIDNLLLETAELELLYSRPETLKTMIAVWSKKQLPIWNKLEETLHFDYNPIHNYDRTETHSDLETRDLAGTNDRTYSSRQNRDNTTNVTQDEDSTLSKAAYDSGAMVDAEGTTDSRRSNQVDDETVTRADTDNTDSTDTGTVKHDFEMRAFGNIGVTTTQQMIEQEREIRKFSIYDYIISEFKNRFCILVY